MVPRENKNNAYAKFGGTNKEYYGIFRTGLLQKQHFLISYLKTLSVGPARVRYEPMTSAR